MNQILIIEDEAVIRGAVCRLLERHGYVVEEAANLAEARSAHRLEHADLVIADLRLPDGEGTEVIDATDAPVLIMTSYASVRSAVESMKLGAVDYIPKPFDHDELVLTVERTLKQNALARQNARLRSELSRNYPVAGMIGESAGMRAVFERIRKVAPTDTTVLILGESGTGKELVARAVHEASERGEGPIVAVNCAAVPEGLIESELFGHEKGAFTGAVGARQGLVEAATGGTLFLDEIGELPAAAQSRLLRVLQEGEIRRVGADQPRRVDVRLMAATNRDLLRAVQQGEFRRDLYFRLSVMEIHLPPLRKRGRDIPLLARFLLQRVCERLNRPLLQLDDEALAAIRRYRWPGNVRELENALERAAILCEHECISAELLALDRGGDAQGHEEPRAEWSLDEYFVQFVREHEQDLTETELAKRLGISRKTLWERRARHGIPRARP